jgi:hypothetical protein
MGRSNSVILVHAKDAKRAKKKADAADFYRAHLLQTVRQRTGNCRAVVRYIAAHDHGCLLSPLPGRR